MKLRLISRLIVVTLVVVVGVIIIVHQISTTSNGSHPPQTTPTASPHSYISRFHDTAKLRDGQFGLFEQATPVWTAYTAYPMRVASGDAMLAFPDA